MEFGIDHLFQASGQLIADRGTLIVSFQECDCATRREIVSQCDLDMSIRFDHDEIAVRTAGKERTPCQHTNKAHLEPEKDFVRVKVHPFAKLSRGDEGQRATTPREAKAT